VDAFIARLEREFSRPVVRSDETLTSEEALKFLKNGTKRHPANAAQWRRFRQTGRVDSGAAVLILQDHLEALRARAPAVAGIGIDGPDGDLRAGAWR